MDVCLREKGGFCGRDRMVVEFTTTFVHMQSVPITTNRVQILLTRRTRYNIM